MLTTFFLLLQLLSWPTKTALGKYSHVRRMPRDQFAESCWFVPHCMAHVNRRWPLRWRFGVRAPALAAKCFLMKSGVRKLVLLSVKSNVCIFKNKCKHFAKMNVHMQTQLYFFCFFSYFINKSGCYAVAFTGASTSIGYGIQTRSPNLVADISHLEWSQRLAGNWPSSSSLRRETFPAAVVSLGLPISRI